MSNVDPEIETKRTEFLTHLWDLIDYWEEVEGRNTREKLEGLIHSTLTVIDGYTMRSEGYDLVDQEGRLINGEALNDLFFRVCDDRYQNIEIKAGDLLRHYKSEDAYYRVLAVGTHSETGIRVVTYQKADEEGNKKEPTFRAAYHPDHETIWTRPLQMFREMVELEDGSRVPRFTKIT